MQSFKAPKGTFDLFTNSKEPWQEIRLWQWMEEECKKFSELFGFSEIRTPVFETTELFARGAGDSSDIVEKEMYTFLDKGERSFSLRPELTACLVRSILEHQLYTKLPCKLYTIASCFRHDRPQAGRYRQFHQWSLESIGIDSPFEDAEMIALAYGFLQRLGIHSTVLKINTIGTPDDRKNFQESLKEFLLPHFEKLSPDSQRRFHTNPLRILDSKESCDKELLQGAPTLCDYINSKSQTHFSLLKESLDRLGIAYQEDPLLVRGLDYYTDTVFEIASLKEGRQNSLLGGGRYNGLFRSLSSIDLPAVGFAAGIERVLLAYLDQGKPHLFTGNKKALFIPLAPDSEISSLCFADALRKKNIACELWLRGKKLSKALSFAAENGFSEAIILGEEEMSQKMATIKRLDQATQEKVDFDSIVPYFEQLRR